MATKADIDQWIASQGGPDAVVHSFEDVEVPDPRGDRSHPDYAREFKDKKISTRREIWTNKATGAKYAATRTPFANDQFEDIKQEAGTRASTTTGPGRNEPDKEQVEGTPTGRKNPDGSDEYDNTRPVMVSYWPDGRVTRRPLTAPERQQWERDKNGGMTDAETREAQTPKPGTTILKPDGKGGTVAVTTYPDGRRPTTAPVPGVPSEASSKYTQVKQDPNTGKWYGLTSSGAWEEIAGGPGATPGAGAEPEGAPRPSGRLGEAAADLEAYDRWLEPQVRAGKLTAARADQLREQRRSFWQTAIKEQEGIVNAQSTAHGQAITQRGQTLNDVQSRRSNATSIANTTEQQFMGLAGQMGANATGNLAEAIRQARFAAQDFVTMSGGNREVPEAQPGPALQTVNTMPLPGGASMGPGFNPRPNAIGAGAIGNQTAPSGLPAPLLPPRPMTAPVQPAAPASAPRPVAASVPVPAVPAPSAPPVRDSWASDPSTPPVNMDPSQGPVGVMQPSPYFLAGASRGHVYDPTASIQRMIADPRYDNETLRQVVAEEFPGYPIDQLLGAA